MDHLVSEADVFPSIVFITNDLCELEESDDALMMMRF